MKDNAVLVINLSLQMGMVLIESISLIVQMRKLMLRERPGLQLMSR